MERGSNKPLDNGGVNKNPSRLKRVLQNTTLVCFSLLLFFCFLEVCFRLAGYGNLEIYQPDPKLFWKLLPSQNCYTKVGHKPVHINSKGTRGRDFAKDKPENVYRILSLGDSRTFGWGLSEAETYSGVLESLLQDQFGDKLKIEVINAGVNAWSYGQMYAYLRDVGMKYRPDMVILAEANPWTQFSEAKSKKFVDSMARRVWLKNLLRRSAIYHYLIEVKLQKYYSKYRTKFIPVDPDKDQFFKEQQTLSPGLFFEDQILRICELLKANRIKGVMVYIPNEGLFSSSQKSSILQIKEQMSERYNIPLLNLSADFADSKKKLFLPDDPVHPNAEGNKIIAIRLVNLIMNSFHEPLP
jgi:lysophospholipase L1-like esterase